MRFLELVRFAAFEEVPELVFFAGHVTVLPRNSR
jgi:hypothetical protein